MNRKQRTKAARKEDNKRRKGPGRDDDEY